MGDKFKPRQENSSKRKNINSDYHDYGNSTQKPKSNDRKGRQKDKGRSWKKSWQES